MITSPLRQLLWKDAVWDWNQEHNEALADASGSAAVL